MRSKIISLATALVIAIPAISIASDRFNDVPSEHTFHDDIGWLADQGVTRGCNPPDNTEFCPDDPVTRGQMSAFMRRFADTLESAPEPRLVSGGGSDRVIPDNTWAALSTITVNAPTGGGGLLLNGTASFFVGNNTDVGALGILAVTVDQSCPNATGLGTTWETATFAGVDSTTVAGSLPISTGSHQVRLCAIGLHGAPSERTEVVAPTLSALWTADSQISLSAESDVSTDIAAVLERVQDSVERVRADSE